MKLLTKIKVENFECFSIFSNLFLLPNRKSRKMAKIESDPDWPEAGSEEITLEEAVDVSS